MLQRQHALGALQSEDDASHVLPVTPAYLFDVLKRRVLFFLVPFVLIAIFGTVTVLAWPAQYVSKGKILVQSPEIPTNLVQPTVSTVANERMKVIEQRIMTRDNLLEIAKKFKLTAGWRGEVSGTELIDFIRERTVIEPVQVTLQAKPAWNNRQPDAIAFNVGFQYENAAIATKVANELLTKILKEDVNARTNFASETTKFLARDVERIEDRMNEIDSQILDAKVKAQMEKATVGQPGAADGPQTPDKQLAALKGQLAVKSATFSSSHPDIIALKRAIKTMEDEAAGNLKKGTATSTTAKGVKQTAAAEKSALTKVAGDALGLDTLELKRDTLKKELASATQKLAAARLGESLERGQHSERLEVIEQPTLPDKPVSPNRPKLLAVVFALAFMAGGGLLVLVEATDQSVRRPADVSAIIGSHLVVAIPYIFTQREIRRRKRKIILRVVLVMTVTSAAGVAAYLYLPSPDLWYDSLMNKVVKILLR